MKNNKTLIISGEGYKKYDEITFFRGFSILTIVLMHITQNSSLPRIVNTMLSVGGTGVQLFFFCSGFGLYLSYLKKESTFFEFMKKRFLKVYIPYIIVVVLSFIIPYMYNGNRFYALLSHIFLYKMFVPEFESSFGLQFWYISTLFQFYFIFIPLVKFKNKVSDVVFFVGCISLSILWWLLSWKFGISEERIWGSFCLQYLWEFVMGMYFAQLMYFKKMIKIPKNYLIILGFLGLFVAAIIKLNGNGLAVFNDFFAVVGYGGIALYIYSLNIKKVNSFLNIVSFISYELYLVHILVYVSLKQVINNTIILIVLSFIISIFVAFTYKYLLNIFSKSM